MVEWTLPIHGTIKARLTRNFDGIPRIETITNLPMGLARERIFCPAPEDVSGNWLSTVGEGNLSNSLASSLGNFRTRQLDYRLGENVWFSIVALRVEIPLSLEL